MTATMPRRMGLPAQIFAAMLIGSAAGVLGARAGMAAFISDYAAIPGTLFVLLLKVVVNPLIFVSVLCGVASVGDARQLGRLGAKALALFASTTTIAVLTGLVLVNAIQPGAGRERLRERAAVEQGAAAAEASWGRRVQDEVLPAIIQNPIMPGQNPLTIIFVALLLGVALGMLGSEGAPALEVFRALDLAFMAIIRGIMLLAPIGVCALMARVVAELGIDYLVTLAKYCATVIAGLVLHFAFLSCGVAWALGRMPPRRFLRGMIPAFEVAFTTSSSSATLPVSLECVTRRVGADPRIAGFVLPLGATVNMDGTALYTTVASLFVAQVYGIDLSLQQQFMVFLTAIAVSVGTAGIPGASVGLMTIIFSAAGIPAEGIGIVIGVDRLLDMSRTVLNVAGDSAVAVAITRSEGIPFAPAPSGPSVH